ncbi:hypothetical protein ACHAW5_002970 [Stephanodiscus triporus]|uniref:Uncharacterized protein n=1 Tax=Stephanodiscus triporus TaxID=2934178 RepID=A0ABD3PGG0_9STRA
MINPEGAAPSPSPRAGGGRPSSSSTQQPQQQRRPRQQRQDDDDDNDDVNGGGDNNDNAITPELLVDALSGHEDGLLTIAERLMSRYDSGYDAMGEAIVDAFADVQRLFQHVVEAAHAEGAAVERERMEDEWRRRMEELVASANDDDEDDAGMMMGDTDVEGRLYGRTTTGAMGGEYDDDFGVDGVDTERRRRRWRRDGGAGGGADDAVGDGDEIAVDDDDDEDGAAAAPRRRRSRDHHRHEEIVDQDVRDVLIDALRRGRAHRDAGRVAECRRLYELSCASASALLPVDSDHRGRLGLAAARAGGMADDRACAMLRYAMDDVLRSGLSLRRGGGDRDRDRDRGGGERRGDCVLPRSTSGGASGGGGDRRRRGDDDDDDDGDGASGRVRQSAEEALNSLVEEMKEMLAAPVYNLTPLQDVSEKFWIAMEDARRSNARREERLEQALAKIKSDFLFAREEHEEQLSAERGRAESLRRRLNEVSRSMDAASSVAGNATSDGGDGAVAGGGGGRDGLHVPYTPNRPRSAASSRTTGSGGNNTATNGMFFHLGGGDSNRPGGGGGSAESSRRGSHNNRGGSSNQSVVSLGSEFASRAKSLVHLMNCHDGGRGRDGVVDDVARKLNMGRNRSGMEDRPR